MSGRKGWTQNENETRLFPNLELTWRNRNVHWGLLRSIGNSRLVTSSVVWLLVVPIAAKLLAPLAGEHTIEFPPINVPQGLPMTITIALPFSWQRFYLMSWMFVAGQFVYTLACPEIVRKYANYGDYRRDHAGPIQLRAFLSIAIPRSNAIIRGEIMNATLSHPADPTQPKAVYYAVADALDGNKLDDSVGSEFRQNRVFDAILGAERYAHKKWFCVSSAFFAGGLALFAWIVIEGVVEVWKLA